MIKKVIKFKFKQLKCFLKQVANGSWHSILIGQQKFSLAIICKFHFFFNFFLKIMKMKLLFWNKIVLLNCNFLMCTRQDVQDSQCSRAHTLKRSTPSSCSASNQPWRRPFTHRFQHRSQRQARRQRQRLHHRAARRATATSHVVNVRTRPSPPLASVTGVRKTQPSVNVKRRAARVPPITLLMWCLVKCVLRVLRRRSRLWHRRQRQQ